VITADVRRAFEREYRTVRRAEGWGSPDAAYYRALPYADLTGRFPTIWRIRARSYDAFVTHVLAPLEALLGRSLAVADLGAGNCWLSARLADRGHRSIALDLLIDRVDGLGAACHYATTIQTVQAEFDRIPLADASVDLAIFNASLHYSPDLGHTVGEALRVVRAPHGCLVVLDSPYYRDPTSGLRMVDERQRRFEREHGFKSDALGAEHFLTPARLRDLAVQVNVRWQFIEPLTMRGRLGRMLTRVRARREPAAFPVLVGRPC
jgi:SAM-dependent methyltransferase